MKPAQAAAFIALHLLFGIIGYKLADLPGLMIALSILWGLDALVRRQA